MINAAISPALQESPLRLLRNLNLTFEKCIWCFLTLIHVFTALMPSTCYCVLLKLDYLGAVIFLCPPSPIFNNIFPIFIQIDRFIYFSVIIVSFTAFFFLSFFFFLLILFIILFMYDLFIGM